MVTGSSPVPLEGGQILWEGRQRSVSHFPGEKGKKQMKFPCQTLSTITSHLQALSLGGLLPGGS